MRYCKKQFDDLGISAEINSFSPLDGKKEWHIILKVLGWIPAGIQLQSILSARERIISELGARQIMGRLFVADGVVTAPIDGLSCIVQPPLDGTEVAMWLWLTDGKESPYRHILGLNYTSVKVAEHTDSETQSHEILTSYIEDLKQSGMTLAENCLRTWFFVRDIDDNYQGLVVARRNIFAENGLTKDTHFIASTGINGNPIRNGALVHLDTYTVDGLENGQISYLKGSSHLNPTAEYGVTFERGTRISYGDRNHLLISGTASIDNRGQILHPGDASAQTKRMIENIEVLLNEGGCSMADVAHALVYLRNTDYY